jgi:hypothetical protein
MSGQLHHVRRAVEDGCTNSCCCVTLELPTADVALLVSWPGQAATGHLGVTWEGAKWQVAAGAAGLHIAGSVCIPDQHVSSFGASGTVPGAASPSTAASCINMCCLAALARPGCHVCQQQMRCLVGVCGGAAGCAWHWWRSGACIVWLLLCRCMQGEGAGRLAPPFISGSKCWLQSAGLTTLGAGVGRVSPVKHAWLLTRLFVHAHASARQGLGIRRAWAHSAKDWVCELNASPRQKTGAGGVCCTHTRHEGDRVAACMYWAALQRTLCRRLLHCTVTAQTRTGGAFGCLSGSWGCQAASCMHHWDVQTWQVLLDGFRRVPALLTTSDSGPGTHMYAIGRCMLFLSSTCLSMYCWPPKCISCWLVGWLVTFKVTRAPASR